MNKKRCDIFVLDDDLDSLLVIDDLLKSYGYSTICETDGEKSIQKIKESKPSLLLLDVYMPGTSGIEVCKILRRDKTFVDLPIIFITASTENHILREAFEAGGNDYVRKPVNSIELITRTSSALAQSEMHKALLEKEKLNGVLEMAGTVCHDLNQPLQVILGYSQILKMETPRNSPANEMAGKIETQVENISRIISKIMRISRYETQAYPGNKKIIDLDKASKGLSCGKNQQHAIRL